MDEPNKPEPTFTQALERKFESIFERLMQEIDRDEIIRDVEMLRAEHPAETRDEIAARLARKAALKTATVGATAGAVGGPLALLAMAPDIFTLVREQSRLTLAIAFLYGQKPDLDERSREVLAVLAVATGTTVARSGARTIITKGLESKLADGSDVEARIKELEAQRDELADRLEKVLGLIDGVLSDGD